MAKGGRTDARCIAWAGSGWAVKKWSSKEMGHAMDTQRGSANQEGGMRLTAVRTDQAGFVQSLLTDHAHITYTMITEQGMLQKQL